MTNLALGDFDHGNSVNFAAELERKLARANLFLFVKNQVMPGHFHRGLTTFVTAEEFKEFCPTFV